MRTVIALIVLVAAGLVVYNVATTGEVRLLPRRMSAEEREIAELERQLAAVKGEFERAVKAAAGSSAEVKAQVEAARVQVQRIQQRLDATVARLGAVTRERAHRWSNRAADRARALERAVEAFRRELRKPSGQGEP
jgi:hypothetical protein